MKEPSVGKGNEQSEWKGMARVPEGEREEGREGRDRRRRFTEGARKSGRMNPRALKALRVVCWARLSLLVSAACYYFFLDLVVCLSNLCPFSLLVAHYVCLTNILYSINYSFFVACLFVYPFVHLR